MARHRRGYTGELRSVKVTVQLTPGERADLAAAARAAGATLSQHGREVWLRRATTPGPAVAGTHRDPDRKALMGQLTAIGNNLNQLTRLSHTMQSVPQLAELQATTDALKATMRRVLATYDPAP